MTVKLPEAISDESLAMVRGAIQELQHERGAFEGFVSETLDALEALRVVLDSKEEALSARTDALAGKEAEIQAALDELETQTDDGQDYEAQIHQLEDESRALQQDRDQLRSKLDEATEELASMANLLHLVEAAQLELQETKAKLEETRNELASREDDPPKEEVEQLKRQCVDLKQAKSELQRQLEESREEANQLADQAHEQSEQLISYRQKWLRALQGMKQAIDQRRGGTTAPEASDRDAAAGDDDWDEALSAAAGESPAEHDPRSEENVAPAEKSATVVKSDDPVVGLVLSELAKLENATKQ